MFQKFLADIIYALSLGHSLDDIVPYGVSERGISFYAAGALEPSESVGAETAKGLGKVREAEIKGCTPITY